MSVSQSNLSDPKYGFDLVVAVTQVSVNTTLEQLLAELTEPEVTVCYVYNSSNDIVPIDFATLVANAKGSNPFDVPAGADPDTNQDLINLTAANFAGGARATIGLPDLPPSSLPPIAQLGDGSNAPVRFNLLCSDFQIVGFEYGPRGSTTWINQSQPAGSDPWYFSSEVSLDTTTVDPTSPVPPKVQERIIELQHQVQNAFTIQKLYLDLDTAILATVPTIEGIPEGWPVWALISTVFLGAYFTQLRQTGDPVLSYSFTVQAPRPTTLELGSVSMECLRPLGSGSTPTAAQLNATALVYVGSQSTTAPIPVPFGWDWIDPDDVDDYSGVQAVRRDVFLTYFAELAAGGAAPLCIDTNISMTHSGDDFTVTLSSGLSPKPSTFSPISPPGPPDSDGFVDVLAISFASNSSDNSTSASHAVKIWGDFSYNMSGKVAVNNNQIRIQVTSALYMSYQHKELFVNYTDLPGANYYDKTLTVIYTLAVDQFGALQVTQTNSVKDNSAAWNFTAKGLDGVFGLEDQLKTGLAQAETLLAKYIDSAFTNFVDQVTETINGYRAWVFPGNAAFTFKEVAFSSSQDLTATLTYVNPN